MHQVSAGASLPSLCPFLLLCHTRSQVATHRSLTFTYLMAFNAALMLLPENLSYDWQMGSIPLVTSLHDVRNLMSVSVVGAILLLCYTCRSRIFDATHRLVPVSVANRVCKSLVHNSDPSSSRCRSIRGQDEVSERPEAWAGLCVC